MQNIEAVLFDMDGIIIDSEPLQLMAYNVVLQKSGFLLSEEDFTKDCVGHKGYEVWEYLCSKFNLPESPSELLNQKNEVYTDLMKYGIQPMPGLLELLDHLQNKYLLAVASSSSLVDIAHILKMIGVSDRFLKLASGEEVEHGKPAPDVFLLAAQRLGVKPENCVVIEDSQTGVESAANANMYCIAVPNHFTEKQNFSQAKSKVSSLFAVKNLL